MSSAAAEGAAPSIQTEVHLSPTCSLVGRTSRIALTGELAGGSEGLRGGPPSGAAEGLKCGPAPGALEGAEAQNREVHSFLGVPFAEPPVGARKFKDPEPLPLWTGARQATEFGLCMILLAFIVYICVYLRLLLVNHVQLSRVQFG